MTPFRYFEPKDGLPDLKGFQLSEIPSQGITQVNRKVQDVGKSKSSAM